MPLSPAHVVVLGAGVAGLCTADALVRRGCRVTVFDRSIAPREGCSYGNGGLVVPSHFEPLANPSLLRAGLKMLLRSDSPFGIRGAHRWEVGSWLLRFWTAAKPDYVVRMAPVLRDLNLASRELYAERFAELDFGFERRGELMICQTAAGFDAESHLAEKAQQLGLHTEIWDHAELARREPNLQLNALGAVYFADDAHLNPARFMDALTRSLESRGVEIRRGGEFQRFETDASGIRRIAVDNETIEADRYVLATGAWTGRLAGTLGLKVPLLAGRGYGFTVANPPEMPHFPAILTEGRVAVTPMPEGVRFVGTMELGLPETSAVNPARLRGMRATILNAYPAFRESDLTAAPVWSGLRPCSPDGMPFLGATQRYPNLILATGHGMMGMSLGPITGELVAQIAFGEPSPIPLDPMNPDRYAERPR